MTTIHQTEKGILVITRAVDVPLDKILLIKTTGF
jgi:hypothetical protein